MRSLSVAKLTSLEWKNWNSNSLEVTAVVVIVVVSDHDYYSDNKSYLSAVSDLIQVISIYKYKNKLNFTSGSIISNSNSKKSVCSVLLTLVVLSAKSFYI